MQVLGCAANSFTSHVTTGVRVHLSLSLTLREAVWPTLVWPVNLQMPCRCCSLQALPFPQQSHIHKLDVWAGNVQACERASAPRLQDN